MESSVSSMTCSSSAIGVRLAEILQNKQERRVNTFELLQTVATHLLPWDSLGLLHVASPFTSFRSSVLALFCTPSSCRTRADRTSIIVSVYPISCRYLGKGERVKTGTNLQVIQLTAWEVDGPVSRWRYCLEGSSFGFQSIHLKTERKKKYIFKKQIIGFEETDLFLHGRIQEASFRLDLNPFHILVCEIWL
jgi:hypothetical protein